MADKSTQEAIKKLVDARPRALLDTIDAELATQQNFEGSQVALVGGLRFLVDDYRRQAELVMDSGARGKGAEATALRSTASTLSLLADAVLKIDTDAPEPTPSRGGPAIPAEWCGSSDDHGPHIWQNNIGNLQCLGRRPTDLSGLDALIAERSAWPRVIPVQDSGVTVLDPPITVAAGETVFFGFAEPGPIAPRGFYPADPPDGTQASTDLSDMHAELAELAARPSFDDVALGDAPDRATESERMRAYLAGETDIMPGDAPLPASPLPQVAKDEFEAILTSGAAPYSEAVMFAEPTPLGRPYGTEPDMPGRRVTFAELRKPAPVPVVLHTSNSQVTQMNDCGLQGRLSRYEPGVIERPQWHLAGGKAVHRVAEEFERMVLEVKKNPQFVHDRVKVAGGAAGLWKIAFNAEIMLQVLACPQVPQDDWRAAGRGGSEGYTWWFTQGPDMVQRYLDLRMTELDRVILYGPNWPDDAPILEYAGTLDVEGTPHKVVIDQAWRLGANDVAIDDLKSGANAPRGGTFQLAQYAWFLRNTLGYTDCKIYGRYWDARKGTYSAPVDLIELHPWDEIVWRIKDAQAKKEMGLFGANPGPFCGGCSVKHACPVVTR